MPTVFLTLLCLSIVVLPISTRAEGEASPAPSSPEPASEFAEAPAGEAHPSHQPPPIPTESDRFAPSEAHLQPALRARPRPRAKVAQSRYSSPGMRYTGIGFTVVGGVSLLFGASSFILAGLSEAGDPPDPGDDNYANSHNSTDSGSDLVGFGIGFLVAGGAFAAVGIPLLVSGSKQLPVESVQIVPGLGGASLRGTF